MNWPYMNPLKIIKSLFRVLPSLFLTNQLVRKHPAIEFKKSSVCIILFSCLLPTSIVYSQTEEPEGIEEVQQEAVEQEVDEPLIDEALILEPETLAQVSAQLRKDLESQFQQIQSLIKSEDAYSERLGEEYLNYGLLLKQVGRLEEARENFVDSLHISKVNDGVYSIEQRPALRALFDTHLLLGRVSDSVENYEKILWLENKHPTEIGTYSFDLAVKLGHHYLDKFLIQRVKSDISIVFLDKAVHYFSSAVNRYGNKPIDQLLMPYGELSEAFYYRSRLNQRVNKVRDFSVSGRDDRFDPFRRLDRKNFVKNSFSKSELYARLHLSKAEDEKSQRQIVLALLALGDSNLLFNRKKPAASFYKSAWEEAQKLPADDPIVYSFNEPVLLPAFNYSIEKELPKRQGATYAFLPVIANIDETGKVTSVFENVAGAVSAKAASRARRIVKNSKFRPIIQNGEMLPSSQHEETIRVVVPN